MQSNEITNERLAGMIAEQNRWLAEEERIEQASVMVAPNRFSGSRQRFAWMLTRMSRPLTARNAGLLSRLNTHGAIRARWSVRNMTRIETDNQGFWAKYYEITTGTLDVFRHMLKTHALDPRFEQYGNFVLDDEPETATRFWGNFWDASCVFSIDTDDAELIAELTALIRANQATPAYLEAKESRRVADERDALERERKYREAHERRVRQLEAMAQ